MVAMNLEEFEENHPEVLIIQIDAGEYKTLTDLYKVKTAPTLLFFKMVIILIDIKVLLKLKK